MITALGVSGIPELDASFRALRLTLQIAAVEGAKVAGNIFAGEWKKNIEEQGWASGHAPVDPRNVPPHGYYDSITIGEPVVAPGSVGLEVFSDIEPRSDQPYSYPFYQEYGTSRNPARPTMTPAYETKQIEAEDAIRKAIQEAALLHFPSRWTPTRGKFLNFSQIRGFGGVALQ